MAIYHLHCDIIGRSCGRSATAAAAYRATCKIEDRTTGEKFDYTRKSKALFCEILTNGNAPEWATDRAELWNSCEEKENRKNSQFCRSFDLALMKEFDQETNLKLVRKWAIDNYVSRGLVADIAIHAPHKNTDGTTNKNIHAHVLVPTRKMDSQGWTDKDREANENKFLRKVRKSWADIVNAEFIARGMSERIDERTLEEQGIDREPQQHQGATATDMERKGKTPDRKKYKSLENQEEEVTVSDEEIQKALELDIDYCVLVEKRKRAVEEMQTPEAIASEKFEQLKPNVTDRSTANEYINFYKRNQLFHYVKQNAQEEVNYWRSIKSNDWHDEAYNQGIDRQIQTVKTIYQHEKFDNVIYPTVDKYYSDCSGFAYNKKGHWDKITNWIATTDFKPVAICRNFIQKLRDFRDEQFPKNSRKRGYGGPSWS